MWAILRGRVRREGDPDLGNVQTTPSFGEFGEVEDPGMSDKYNPQLA